MKIPNRPLSGLASARIRLGLTQQQMALQLGISLSMVKMVETNQRSLSNEALVKLAALEIQLAGVPQNNKKQLPASAKKLYEDAGSGYALETRYHETRCVHRALQLERRLAKMERDHDSLLASLHNIDSISKIKLDESDPIVNGILLARPGLLKKLRNCSPHAQAITRKKIVLLRAEAALNKSIQPRYVHTNEKPNLSPLKQSNMDYTVSLISNRADCQAMIDMANDDKDALSYRQTGLERQKQNASVTSVSIDSDLASVTAELDALNTVVAGMPEGTVKEDTKVKAKKAEYKKFLLEQRKANYGSLALVGKEYDIACITQSIAETDAFIQALTARFNELPAA